MPVYEYLCKHCDGVFEAILPIARAAERASCPVCAKKGHRLPPSSFSAFTMREGYARAIPDRGTYWHLEKEVKRPVTGAVRMNEHPEINKPEPKRRKTQGEQAISTERKRLEAKEKARARKDGMPEIIDRTRRSSDD